HILTFLWVDNTYIRSQLKWCRVGLVVGSQPCCLRAPGSKSDFTEDPSCIGLPHVKSCVGCQPPSRWPGAEAWRGGLEVSSSGRGSKSQMRSVPK
ncbi:hypothetical protein AVEN_78668-1, partial [Araneus ventricosus]